MRFCALHELGNQSKARNAWPTFGLRTQASLEQVFFDRRFQKQGKSVQVRFIDDSALECKCGDIPQPMGYKRLWPACTISCTVTRSDGR